MVDLAKVLDTGAGIAVEVPVASILTVKATGVGAVHPKASQLHVSDLRVTEIVLSVDGPAQSAKVVVILTTIVVSAAICVGYRVLSTYSSFFPDVVVDSCTTAQFEIATPSALLATA